MGQKEKGKMVHILPTQSSIHDMVSPFHVAFPTLSFTFLALITTSNYNGPKKKCFMLIWYLQKMVDSNFHKSLEFHITLTRMQ